MENEKIYYAVIRLKHDRKYVVISHKWIQDFNISYQCNYGLANKHFTVFYSNNPSDSPNFTLPVQKNFDSTIQSCYKARTIRFEGSYVAATAYLKGLEQQRKHSGRAKANKFKIEKTLAHTQGTVQALTTKIFGKVVEIDWNVWDNAELLHGGPLDMGEETTQKYLKDFIQYTKDFASNDVQDVDVDDVFGSDFCFQIGPKNERIFTEYDIAISAANLSNLHPIQKTPADNIAGNIMFLKTLLTILEPMDKLLTGKISRQAYEFSKRAFEIRFRRAPFSEKEYNDHVKRIIRALKAEQENGALDITIE